MIPFNKIYSAIFKSFNINSETETIERLKKEGVSKIMIIKRSWIFGLAMIWIPILITLIAIGNIYISYFSYQDEVLKYGLLIGVLFSLTLFVFSVWSYLMHFRTVYDAPRIENDTEVLLKSANEGDRYFIRFFNQTILNQWILLGLFIWSIVFYFTHTKVTWAAWIMIDGVLLFIQWILLGKYRKKMMDLEMDYNIVVPGKIIFVNQSGMLSSSQAVEGEKVKTVTARYPSWLASIFQFGTIEIMTEGGESNLGTTSMYFVPHPNETAALIQTLLSKDEESSTGTPRNNSKNRAPESPESTELTYGVKGTVRDVMG